jgi:hypothetical protein
MKNIKYRVVFDVIILPILLAPLAYFSFDTYPQLTVAVSVGLITFMLGVISYLLISTFDRLKEHILKDHIEKYNMEHPPMKSREDTRKAMEDELKKVFPGFKIMTEKELNDMADLTKVPIEILEKDLIQSIEDEDYEAAEIIRVELSRRKEKRGKS